MLANRNHQHYRRGRWRIYDLHAQNMHLASWHLIETFTPSLTVQRQRALQETRAVGHRTLCASGSPRLMAPISQRLRTPTAPRNSNLLSLSLNRHWHVLQLQLVLRAGTLAGVSTIDTGSGQAHPHCTCMYVGLGLMVWSWVLVWVCHVTFHQ